MMPGTGQAKINTVAVDAFMAKVSKASARRGAVALQQRVKNNILADGLVDTGDLLHSIKIRDDTVIPTRPHFTVYSDDPKAKYPEFGTQGAEAAPGHVLAFFPKGSPIMIFRKRVGPIRPYRFFRNAILAMSKRDFQ